MTQAPALRLVPTAVERVAPDTTALERVAAGDSRALGEVYERHAAGLLRFAIRAVGADDAEDLVHATFVTAAKVAETYDGRSDTARPWLHGIMGRLVQERRRAFARFAKMLFRSRPENQGWGEHTDSLRADLVRGLSRLSEPKRVVLLLAEVEGYACDEIAEMLRIPVGTVWTRLHHARKDLRSFYGGEPS